MVKLFYNLLIKIDLLQCLRLSLQIKVWKELPRLLDAVTPHLDKYSLQCLTHVALLTAPSQTFHPPSLDSVSQRLIVNIKESRLKVRKDDLNRKFIL